MQKNVKKLAKTLFRVCGLDIKRVDPTENNYGWLAKHNITTVLDIGANTGQFAQWIHKILPNAAITSFEPIGWCYNHLVKNMINVPNFRAFNYALGDTDTKMQMHVNDSTPSSSLLPMANLHVQAFPYTANEHIEEVKIRRLDEVAQELGFDGNLLVKIDVQGYEDRVIRGGHSVMLQTRVLIVETTFQCLYVDQLLFDYIYDMLWKLGFRYVGNLSQLKSPLDGSVLQADSIFVRKLVE